MENATEINRTKNQIFYSDGSIGPTEYAEKFMEQCMIDSPGIEAELRVLDRKERRDTSVPKKSNMFAQAVNHRWAYAAMRDGLFLQEVIFDESRNEFFHKRYTRAIEGLNDGYQFRRQQVPGKFHAIEGVLVKNTHNNKIYIVRHYKGRGKRGLASCTCQDFRRNKKYKTPCKHIWMALLSERMGDPIKGWQ